MYTIAKRQSRLSMLNMKPPKMKTSCIFLLVHFAFVAQTLHIMSHPIAGAIRL
jgi:hypothetical protein